MPGRTGGKGGPPGGGIGGKQGIECGTGIVMTRGGIIAGASGGTAETGVGGASANS